MSQNRDHAHGHHEHRDALGNPEEFERYLERLESPSAGLGLVGEETFLPYQYFVSLAPLRR